MLKTIIPQNNEEWLALRAKNINSTESSALFGLSPYMTKFELWHRKKAGDIVIIEENDRMKWGKRLEAAIAEQFAEDFGWNIRPMKEYMYDDELRTGSSFDYSIDDDGLAEIKNVDGFVYRKDWDENNAPLHIEMQVQHEMMVSGRQYNYICALVGGNNGKPIKRIRDEVVISRIREEIKKFWISIDENKPPPPDFVADAEFISELYGFAEPNKVFDARGNEKIFEMMSEHKRLGEEAKDLTKKREAIKAEILTIIGDAEKVEGDGFNISAGIVSGTHISYDRAPYRMFKPSWRNKK